MAMAGCGPTDGISSEAAESYDEAAPMNGGDAGISVFSGERGEATRIAAEERRLSTQREVERRRAKGAAAREANLTGRGSETAFERECRHADAVWCHEGVMRRRSLKAWQIHLRSTTRAELARDTREADTKALKSQQIHLFQGRVHSLEAADERMHGDAMFGAASSRGTAQERPSTAGKTKEEITAARRARGRALLEARKIGDLATEEAILAEAEAIRCARPDILPHLNTPNGTRYHEGAVAQSIEGSVRALRARRADTEAPSYSEIDARPATGIPSIWRHDEEDAIVRGARLQFALPFTTSAQHDETPVRGFGYFDRSEGDAATDVECMHEHRALRGRWMEQVEGSAAAAEDADGEDADDEDADDEDE